MTKISHHFRIDEIRTKELIKLAEIKSLQQAMSDLPAKKVTKTDVIEDLISREYFRLVQEGLVDPVVIKD